MKRLNGTLLAALAAGCCLCPAANADDDDAGVDLRRIARAQGAQIQLLYKFMPDILKAEYAERLGEKYLADFLVDGKAPEPSWADARDAGLLALDVVPIGKLSKLKKLYPKTLGKLVTSGQRLRKLDRAARTAKQLGRTLPAEARLAEKARKLARAVTGQAAEIKRARKRLDGLKVGTQAYVEATSELTRMERAYQLAHQEWSAAKQALRTVKQAPRYMAVLEKVAARHGENARQMTTLLGEMDYWTRRLFVTQGLTKGTQALKKRAKEEAMEAIFGPEDDQASLPKGDAAMGWLFTHQWQDATEQRGLAQAIKGAKQDAADALRDARNIREAILRQREAYRELKDELETRQLLDEASLEKIDAFERMVKQTKGQMRANYAMQRRYEKALAKLLDDYETAKAVERLLQEAYVVGATEDAADHHGVTVERLALTPDTPGRFWPHPYDEPVTELQRQVRDGELSHGDYLLRLWVIGSQIGLPDANWIMRRVPDQEEATTPEAFREQRRFEQLRELMSRRGQLRGLPRSSPPPDASGPTPAPAPGTASQRELPYSPLQSSRTRQHRRDRR